MSTEGDGFLLLGGQSAGGTDDVHLLGPAKPTGTKGDARISARLTCSAAGVPARSRMCSAAAPAARSSGCCLVAATHPVAGLSCSSNGTVDQRRPPHLAASQTPR
jgi:hypothetical protein